MSSSSLSKGSSDSASASAQALKSTAKKACDFNSTVNSRQSSTVNTSTPSSAHHFEASTEFLTYIPCRRTAIGWPTVDSGACLRLIQYYILIQRADPSMVSPSTTAFHIARTNQSDAASAGIFSRDVPITTKS
eukprot:1183800-Prorocentrum_minimum.AAC.2